MVGGGEAGQLVQAMTSYFYAGGQARQKVQAAFLLKRIPVFLRDTQWPGVYRRHFEDLDDYAFDLAARAAWKKATRQEWAVSGRRLQRPLGSAES